MSPFPIFLEAPVLNPCLKHEQLIKEILDNVSAVTKNDIDIMEKILRKYPNELKESYFIDKL